MWVIVIIVAFLLAIFWFYNSSRRIKEFQREEFIKQLELPKMEIPKIEMPEIEMPDLEILEEEIEILENNEQ
ncbi:MAG: hypothetical protein FJZ07_01330 [Candidatus Nealsonbacteria bacterium]|nr:hypothetical protein [Candidatus Nealsonbacteria bacterium]